MLQKNISDILKYSAQNLLLKRRMSSFIKKKKRKQELILQKHGWESRLCALSS